MSKKSVKIISILSTIALVLMVLSNTLLAYTPNDVNPNENGLGNVTAAGESILGIIRTVGILISVGVLMFLGIRYMMGSAEEKASYKKTMLPYLVGAVLLFGASAFAQVIFDYVT